MSRHDSQRQSPLELYRILGSLPFSPIRLLGIALQFAVNQRHLESLACRGNFHSSLRDGIVLMYHRDAGTFRKLITFNSARSKTSEQAWFGTLGTEDPESTLPICALPDLLSSGNN